MEIDLFYSLVKPSTKFEKLNLRNRILYKLINIIFPTLYQVLPSRKTGTAVEKSTGGPDVPEELIVSLTTIPSRIDKVWISIETLMRQKRKPNRIILWLGEKEFEGITLPKQLLRLTKRGLTIERRDDFGPHTKYFYAMKEFPKAIIITVDDDVFYPSTLVGDLVEAYARYPDAIACSRAHKITFHEDKTVRRYGEWNHFAPFLNEPSHLLMQTGIGGVLYPPHSLYKDALDSGLFCRLCPKSDDIWLKMMALLQGTKIVRTRPLTIELATITGSQKVSLRDYNIKNRKNEEQLDNLIRHYGLEQRIREMAKAESNLE